MIPRPGLGDALTLRHRLLGPIRVRLALLVLIAAVPLLLLSGTIALQNYRLALAATAETAARLRESAIARHVVGHHRRRADAAGVGAGVPAGQ